MMQGNRGDLTILGADGMADSALIECQNGIDKVRGEHGFRRCRQCGAGLMIHPIHYPEFGPDFHEFRHDIGIQQDHGNRLPPIPPRQKGLIVFRRPAEFGFPPIALFGDHS